MYTIQLNIDDSIFDDFMESINKLPKEKYEFVSEKKDINGLVGANTKAISSEEEKINKLLETHRLSHFKFFTNPDRILFSKEAGSTNCMDDYKRLVILLEENNIKHSDIGIDVLFIEK